MRPILLEAIAICTLLGGCSVASHSPSSTSSLAAHQTTVPKSAKLYQEPSLQIKYGAHIVQAGATLTRQSGSELSIIISDFPKSYTGQILLDGVDIGIAGPDTTTITLADDPSDSTARLARPGLTGSHLISIQKKAATQSLHSITPFRLVSNRCFVAYPPPSRVLIIQVNSPNRVNQLRYAHLMALNFDLHAIRAFPPRLGQVN